MAVLDENRSTETTGLRVAQRLWAAAILCVVIAIFLFIWLGARGIVNMTSTFGICGFKQSYGLPCPGCGITTSAMAFIDGHFLEAFYIQPAGTLLLCILLGIGVLSLLISVFGVNFGFLHRSVNPVTFVKYVFLSLLVIFVSGWAVTLARVMATRKDF